ncbi:hypothetical protein CVIRNUC_000349 [Coccomyxa viridis]|uniref:Uncharacterized protein n=1 Tax=Coccomyxa viridis TaxID=1274662 RepID=A0AAV1HTH4_9CHLO|nr:hypothetical protein CVIRNUC_000349 [Coccomyxa viridis]
MNTDTCLQPRQSHPHTIPSVTSHIEVADSTQKGLSIRANAGESRNYRGVELPCQLWVAELGRPQTTWLYRPIHNSLDVITIARRLRWKFNEIDEIALYERSMLSQLAEKDFVAKKQEYYSSRCGQQGSQGPHEQAAELSQ